LGRTKSEPENGGGTKAPYQKRRLIMAKPSTTSRARVTDAALERRLDRLGLTGQEDDWTDRYLLCEHLVDLRTTLPRQRFEAVARFIRDLVAHRWVKFMRKRPDWMIFRDGCPGGESPEQIGARVDRVIAKARAAEGNVALFAHGHVFRVLAARWIGLSSRAGEHFLLNTATLNVLGYYRDTPALKIWNAPLHR
jgi:Histidine phosphatase superfamily (branch 1)